MSSRLIAVDLGCSALGLVANLRHLPFRQQVSKYEEPVCLEETYLIIGKHGPPGSSPLGELGEYHLVQFDLGYHHDGSLNLQIET